MCQKRRYFPKFIQPNMGLLNSIFDDLQVLYEFEKKYKPWKKTGVLKESLSVEKNGLVWSFNEERRKFNRIIWC